MQGLLLVDKPSEWTSFDVVNYIRTALARSAGVKPKSIKVGHIGTLDPLATGLLVILIGKDYTRRATELTKLDKVYEVTMHLGCVSSTGDDEGEKHFVSDRIPTKSEIRIVLSRFTGHLDQVPPAFSAIKVQGRRAYSLARAGQSVVLQSRPIMILQNVLKVYNYPLVHFVSTVSSGTYIRALVADIGKELKTGAYMSDLRRTKIGKYCVEDAVTVHNLDADLIVSRLQVLN